MFNKLKQFQNLKHRAKRIQQTLGQESVEGSAGWGKVKITMDGNQKIQRVHIHPDLMTDRTKLEELMRDAGNDAIGKIQKVMASKLKQLGGLDLAAEFGDAIKKT